MKRRLLAIFMMVTMIITMVPIVALADDLPNVTIVDSSLKAIEGADGWLNCDSYWDEELQDSVLDPTKSYTYYSPSPRFVVDTDEGEIEVGVCEPFEYRGNTYCINANIYDGDEFFNQCYDNQVIIGEQYQGKATLVNANDDWIPVQEDIAEFTFTVVEKPEISVSFDKTVDLYKGKDTYVGTDCLMDSETGEWHESPEYEKYNCLANMTIECNGETQCDMLNLYGKDYWPEYRFSEGDEQSYENQWQDGDSYTADVYLLGECFGQITFNIHGSIVKSFEIIDDITLVKGISDNGTGCYDFNDHTFFANIEFFDGTKYENARIDYGMFQDGIEYNGSCILVSFSDDQNENPWVDVGDYKEKISVLGYETEITVHLVDTIIDSVDFEDASVYEFTNGWYMDDGTYIYEPDIEMSNIVINVDADILDYNNIGINFNGDWRRVSLLYDQFENPLYSGDKVKADVSIFGYNGEINLEVLKADIIDEMTVVPKKVYVTECTNGYYDGETYIYNVPPQFIVNYADGSVGFDTKFDSNSYEYLLSQRYYEKAIDDYFTYSWHDAAGYDQYENNWVAGNTYKMVFDFIGQQFEYEVEIVPSDVESIEIVETPKAVPEEWGGYNLNPDRILVKVIYKDGTTVKKTCEELGADCCCDLDCITDTLKVTYRGKSDITNVEVATGDTYPIERLVIDESTLKSAYLIDGQYYFSPSDFYVDVYYKDGTTSREYIEKSEPVWLEKDGYKMNLSPIWIDYSTWSDNSHPFSVEVDGGFIQSDEVEINVVDDVTCEKVELITPQTFTYYKNDALFSDCMTGEFFPFDLRGMKAKATMSNGDVYYLLGDNLYTNAYDGSDSFSSLGSSNGVEFRIVDKADGYTSHISINVFGKTYPLYDIKAIDSNIINIEVLNYDELKDNIAQNDATGLKFKVSYADGKAKEIILGKEEQDWIGISWNEMGDGGITPVDEKGTSGIRYSWYKVNGEYASIIWNNRLLRFEDTIVFLDTGKTMKVNSNASEVSVSSASINNDIIDQLTLEERYKVEQQGMDINAEMSIEKTDASKDILKLAAGDDVTINSAYEIDIAYKLDGNTTQITELGDGKILITIKLPDDMLGKDKYVVYREHKNADGTVSVEEIEATLSDDGKYISFESSKFSTFALGYAEDKTPGGGNNGGKLTPGNKPNGGNGNGGNGSGNVAPNGGNIGEKIANTLDNSPIGGTIALMMSSGLCAYAVIKKRREIA